MKSESVLTERGQITIPKNLRDRLGLVGGTRVSFTSSSKGLLIQKARGHFPAKEIYGSISGNSSTDGYIKELRGKVE